MRTRPKDTVEIPPELNAALRNAAKERDYWGKIAKDIEDCIQTLLGDAEYATVNNRPVIRWQHVRSRKISVPRLHEMVDPAILADCYVESPSRRFTVLKEGL